MAQVDCYTGRRWTVGEAGGRTPLISAVALLNYIACSTECQFDFGWGWVRSWGRRLGVSISDSSWSWVVGLLMSGEGHGELQRQLLYPRRAAKDREERQLLHLFPRRAAKNCNVNFFFHGGPRRTATATPFSAEGRGDTRRTATATSLSTKGRGEHFLIRGGSGMRGRNASCSSGTFCLCSEGR